MSRSFATTSGQPDVWQRYRGNFSRHLLGVARHLQNQSMHALQQECGHRNLRLGFAPYIALIGTQGMRLTELATLLGISRQACNQAANQVESAGYIMRKSDSRDGRAKLLVLTAQGMRLREDGRRIAAGLDAQLLAIVGEHALADATKTLDSIYRGLPPGASHQETAGDPVASMGELLPRLTDYVLERLMELTAVQGHHGLKLSFGQVLTLIGPSGGRIQEIAAIQDVSKQAISAIATELEFLGYLRREADPEDARQLVLLFTDRGRALIADSVESVDQLQAEFAAIAGKAALQRLCATLHSLYSALQLEREIFEHNASVDLGLLAKQLQQQLGTEGSQALGQLLLRTPKVKL